MPSTEDQVPKPRSLWGPFSLKCYHSAEGSPVKRTDASHKTLPTQGTQRQAIASPMQDAMVNNHKSKTPKISNSLFVCYKVRGTVPQKALPFYPPICSEWFLPSVSHGRGLNGSRGGGRPWLLRPLNSLPLTENHGHLLYPLPSSDKHVGLRSTC